jgi:hypothetical protein
LFGALLNALNDFRQKSLNTLNDFRQKSLNALNDFRQKSLNALNDFAFFLERWKWTFEIGGPDKSFDQIADLPNSYVFADFTDIPVGKKLPLFP